MRIGAVEGMYSPLDLTTLQYAETGCCLLEMLQLRFKIRTYKNDERRTHIGI